jgi:hypothetical protein
MTMDIEIDEEYWSSLLEYVDENIYNIDEEYFDLPDRIEDL